jgi:hypothetical protein
MVRHDQFCVIQSLQNCEMASPFHRLPAAGRRCALPWELLQGAFAGFRRGRYDCVAVQEKSLRLSNAENDRAG